MATSKRIARPVVFLTGCEFDLVPPIIGNNNGYTHQLFGVKPLFVCREKYNWLFNPKDDDFERLEELKPPAFHDIEVEEWIHLNGFRDFVRQYLRNRIVDECGEPVDPADVRIVVCGSLGSTEEAFKAERILAEVFPNAMLRENPSDTSVLQPLVRDVKVEELELSNRASSCLVRRGIYTLGILRQKSEAELMVIPGIGRKSVNEIQEILRQHDEAS